MSTVTPPTIISSSAAARPRLNVALDTLHRLAVHSPEPEAFYSEWLGVLRAVTPLEHARVWSRATGKWQIIASVGERAEEPSTTSWKKQSELLDQIAETGRPAVFREPSEHPSVVSATSIWQPLSSGSELRGIAEIHIPRERSVNILGTLNVLASAEKSAELFHLLRDRREAALIAGRRDRLFRQAHSSLSLERTARVLADEGRLHVGCDRLTVLVGRTVRQRVAAVSGQEDFDKRSPTVKYLSVIAERSIVLNTVLIFPDEQAGYDDETVRHLERYADDHDVRRIVVLPIVESTSDGDDVGRAPQIVGTLIAEHFHQPQSIGADVEALKRIAECASTSLRNAVEFESIFAGKLLHRVGTLRRELLEKGKRHRLAAIAATLVAIVAVSFGVQVDDTTYCRGVLKPVERRNIFTASDGIVRTVFVTHGRRVKKNEPLAELQNSELDLLEADLAGKQTTTGERLMAVERALLDGQKSMTASERARLAGEQNELREELAALNRQAKLYSERRELLTIRSPLDGEITTWNAEHLLENRPVRRGQTLLTVAAIDGPWELELTVPDGRSGRVIESAAGSSEPLAVTFSPALRPGEIQTGRLLEIQNSAEVHAVDGNSVLVRAAVASDAASALRPGAEVAAHIHLGRRSLAIVWSRDVVDFVRSRILFRWF